MIFIVYGVLLLVYWVCPKYIKIAAMILNFLIPDPIPYIDEIVMVAGFLNSNS